MASLRSSVVASVVALAACTADVGEDAAATEEEVASGHPAHAFPRP